jgi:aspartate/methionine/tyrosine aminotransferase
MFDRTPAPYMRWAKTRPVPRFDLAGSNLLELTPDEWPAAREAPVIAERNCDGLPRLVEAIAAHAEVDPSRVATAVGSSGANFLAIATLVRAGDDVLIEHPNYDPLPGAARLMGATVRTFERRFEDGYRIDVERLRAAITPRTRLIVLTNPHNPTGALIERETMSAIGAVADAAGAHVLVDEVYLETVYSRSMVSAAQLGDVFVISSSLTKAYGLWGLRCGWAIGSAAVAARMRQTRDVIDGVGPVPAEQLAVRAFADLPAFRARARAIVEPNAARLRAFIATRPELTWVDPEGGTVAFPRFTDIDDSSEFVDRLLARHGTAVVPGRFFEAPRHIRIAFGIDPAVLTPGLEAIGQALDDR